MINTFWTQRPSQWPFWSYLALISQESPKMLVKSGRMTWSLFLDWITILTELKRRCITNWSRIDKRFRNPVGVLSLPTSKIECHLVQTGDLNRAMNLSQSCVLHSSCPAVENKSKIFSRNIFVFIHEQI